MTVKRQRAGFTLIELLVALVVGMLMMATMVGLSGSVQRSFGRSKEINDLQSNLRFAMKTLVDDFGRIAYMYSPDPMQDTAHSIVGSVGGLKPAMDWNPPNLDFWGNYASPRDYLWNQLTGYVACRNKIDPTEPAFPNCGGYEPFLMPFNDGPGRLDDIFCPGVFVRVDVGERRYQYQVVQGVMPDPSPGTGRVLIPGINPDLVHGSHRWINPVNKISYTVRDDPTYTAPFSTPTDAAKNWQLARTVSACRAGALANLSPVILADFLLPQSAAAPGLQMSYIEDSNAALDGKIKTPDLSGPPVQFIPSLGPVPNSVKARAILVVLRGRTSSEDPQLFISTYGTDPAQAQRYGIDLDSVPNDGLAHVREIRTMVELRNLGLDLNI